MLRESADEGRYASRTPVAFADQVTADLADVALDRHLRVMDPGAPMPGGPESAEEPESFGIADSGWLTDDVAFLRISGMPDVPGGREWTAQFMRDHANAKALVIDLRRCPGGSIEMMNGFLSYLYDEPTHLLNMDMRPGADDETETWFNDIPDLRRVETGDDVLRWEHWIEPADSSMPDLPVYVLTDFTASACEHLTAALRATDRATIIGAPTRGAGHFVSFHEFGDGFTVILTVGRTYDPRTGQGWEGNGIAPRRRGRPGRRGCRGTREIGRARRSLGTRGTLPDRARVKPLPRDLELLVALDQAEVFVRVPRVACWSGSGRRSARRRPRSPRRRDTSPRRTSG